MVGSAILQEIESSLQNLLSLEFQVKALNDPSCDAMALQKRISEEIESYKDFLKCAHLAVKAYKVDFYERSVQNLLEEATFTSTMTAEIVSNVRDLNLELDGSLGFTPEHSNCCSTTSTPGSTTINNLLNELRDDENNNTPILSNNLTEGSSEPLLGSEAEDVQRSTRLSKFAHFKIALGLLSPPELLTKSSASKRWKEK